MRKKIILLMLACFASSAMLLHAQRVTSGTHAPTFQKQSEPAEAVWYPEQDAQAPAEGRTCGQVARMEENLRRFPELRQSYQQHLADVERQLREGTTDRTGIVSIPVVVHVIYRTSSQNIPDSQIQSQITILTDDFRRTNSDANQTPSGFLPVAADCNIEFCLADTDPNGNATTGITRTQTTTQNIGLTNQYYQEAPAWPRSSYLNIWVCEVGNQLLGFAQFPGTAPANRDGVVIGYKYFGNSGSVNYPFNEGRTCTHEVGHWLGLRHIWGDGGCGVDDGISDTPQSDAPNYGCPSSHSSCGSADMFMNYMDYTDDRCMNIYTTGQSAVLNATLNGTRSGLKVSNGCSGGGSGSGCGVDTVGFPLTGTAVLYGSDQWGFVGGHNNYLDISKAEYIANTQNMTAIDGLRLQFGYGTSSGPTAKVVVKVWGETAGEPGTVLHQQDLLIDDIIAANGDVTVMFPSAVAVSGPFYAGMGITYVAGDTVAFITNTDGDVPTATAWEQFSNGDWFRFDASPDSWGLDVGFGVFPIAFSNNMSVSVSPASPTISAGGQVSLTASGAFTYAWSPSTGLSCTTCPTPIASPSTTTTYTVIGTDGSGNCTAQSTVTVTVVPVGLQDPLFNETIVAYPNPNNGEFVLEFGMEEISDLDITVYNNIGQRVYSESLEDFSGNYRQAMDLQDVPKGVYHLRISNGKDQFVKKIVVE